MYNTHQTNDDLRVIYSNKENCAYVADYKNEEELERRIDKLGDKIRDLAFDARWKSADLSGTGLTTFIMHDVTNDKIWIEIGNYEPDPDPNHKVVLGIFAYEPGDFFMMNP